MIIDETQATQQEKKITSGPHKNYERLNLSILEQECVSYMLQHGFSNVPLPLDLTGKRVNFCTRNGDKRKTEWYIASIKDNGRLIVTYNSHHTSLRKDDGNYVFNSSSKKPLDETEINAQRERIALHQQKRKQDEENEEKKRKEKVLRDQNRFNKASEKGSSKYLERKKIGAHGIRFESSEKETIILVPMRNENGEIQALQEIFETKRIFGNEKPERDKNYTNATKGLFHLIGKVEEDLPIFICEGYATGSSIFEATGIATVVGFDCGQFDSVIEVLKQKYSKNPIIITADDDIDNDKNPGRNCAEKAVKRHLCHLVLPQFPDNEFRIPNTQSSKYPNGKRPKDFNDLHVYFGLGEVKKQLTKTNSPITSQDELKNLATNLLKKKEPCEGFSTSNLPKLLADYIDSLCEYTRAHPIMITSSVLVTISAFLKKRVFMPKGEYFQKLYTNQWHLSVTKSGRFKSTALDLGASLARERSRKVLGEIKPLESKIKLETSQVRKNELKEELLKHSLEDVLLPNKVTAEAFLEHLSQGHSGVILASEFGAWLLNMEKSHNADLKAIFTELYDVPEVYRYKTKQSGDFILVEPFFSICGVSTIDWLKDNLKPNDVSSGFFARFLVFAPPNQDSIPPALPSQRWSSNSQAESKIKENLEHMDSEYQYRFSPSAKSLFESVHRSLYEMASSYNETSQQILDPYLKRWSPYILKIAMIMRLFEDPTSKELSDTSINSAMAIILPAIKSTAILFEGELGESEHQRKCRILLEWICQRVKNTGQPVKWKDILTSKKLEGGGKEYEYICSTLIESGKIVCREQEKKKDWLYMPYDQMVEKVD